LVSQFRIAILFLGGGGVFTSRYLWVLRHGRALCVAIGELGPRIIGAYPLHHHHHHLYIYRECVYLSGSDISECGWILDKKRRKEESDHRQPCQSTHTTHIFH